MIYKQGNVLDIWFKFQRDNNFYEEYNTFMKELQHDDIPNNKQREERINFSCNPNSVATVGHA